MSSENVEVARTLISSIRTSRGGTAKTTPPRKVFETREYQTKDQALEALGRTSTTDVSI